MKKVNLKHLCIVIIVQSYISFLCGSPVTNIINNPQLLDYLIKAHIIQLMHQEPQTIYIVIEESHLNHFKSFISDIIKNEIEEKSKGTPGDRLSTGLLKCYKKLCNDNNNVFFVEDILGALPNLIIGLQNMKTKAPRPSLSNPVVGPEACSLVTVESLLNEILQKLIQCCTITSDDFNSTFSTIQDIKNTLTTCCEEFLQDFQYTWTILASGFNSTFSVLEAVDGDLTNCCNTMLAKLATIENQVAALSATIVDMQTDVDGITNAVNNSVSIFATIMTTFNACCVTIDSINNTANHITCVATCLAPLCGPQC